jgi:ADP-ribose pyrophosphatase
MHYAERRIILKLEEKTVKETYVFNGRIINVRVDDILLPNGKPATREIVEHNGGVTMVPLTDDNEIIFVKQFRYPYKKVLLEIPAGKLEKGEDHRDAGIRELKEETGATAKDFIFLGEIYPTPGYTEEKIYLYLAKGLTFSEQNLDEDEFLTVEKITLQKAVEMVLNGQINDGKTQIGILKIYAMQKEGKL